MPGHHTNQAAIWHHVVLEPGNPTKNHHWWLATKRFFIPPLVYRNKDPGCLPFLHKLLKWGCGNHLP